VAFVDEKGRRKTDHRDSLGQESFPGEMDEQFDLMEAKADGLVFNGVALWINRYGGTVIRWVYLLERTQASVSGILM